MYNEGYIYIERERERDLILYKEGYTVLPLCFPNLGLIDRGNLKLPRDTITLLEKRT